MSTIDDGRAEITDTHGICPECMEIVEAEMDAGDKKRLSAFAAGRRAGKTLSVAKAMGLIDDDAEPPGAGSDPDTASESEGERLEKARRQKEGRS